MNIYLALELPVNVEIEFDFFPEPLPTKAARKLEEEAMIAEVRRAVTAWQYAEAE